MKTVLLILFLLGPTAMIVGVLINIINDLFPTCPAGFGCYPWAGIAGKFMLAGLAWTIVFVALGILLLIVSAVYR
jgi:hypothetical protein